MVCVGKEMREGPVEVCRPRPEADGGDGWRRMQGGEQPAALSLLIGKEANLQFQAN